MEEPAKTRRYDASGRAVAAARTRRAILDAAFRLFVANGYEATTMSAVAAEAGVAVDTVYESAGRKPALFRLLVESVIAMSDDAVPALERDYVRAVRAEPSAGRKLERYASAVASIQTRLAPLLLVVRGAAATSPEIAQMWSEISQRRAANMQLLAGEMIATGSVRDGLTVDEVAATIWAMNGPELFGLLVQERGWSVEQYAAWLGSSWKRLFLADDATLGENGEASADT
ncbi:MAG: TetR family transcriptional regulator [Chloroflexi bacterium]|nr:TetR family transcriptional regulator [Chloroflexota bacterium]